MSTIDRIETFWEKACSRYPRIPEEMGLSASPFFRLNLWVGKELPDFKGLTFEQFLGGEYEVLDNHPGPLTHFGVAGIIMETSEGFGDCVVGRALYSLDLKEHLDIMQQFGVGWVALQQKYRNDNEVTMKPVGCDRIGGLWVHPEHRRQGLGTFMEVKRWMNTPHATLYMKYAFLQQHSRSGYELQKRVYEELLRKRLF